MTKKKKKEKQNHMKITHLPISSLRSYSSVKRVDVTIEFDTGVLFITAAILIFDVIGDDTFILLLLLLLMLLFVLV